MFFLLLRLAAEHPLQGTPPDQGLSMSPARTVWLGTVGERLRIRRSPLNTVFAGVGDVTRRPMNKIEAVRAACVCIVVSFMLTCNYVYRRLDQTR